jgi:hypothetical protein
MGLENVPRCQHVKVNGTQCGSPALRRRRLCFFHERIRRERSKIAAQTSVQRMFDLPLLEDANAVQVALMKVIQLLGSGGVDHKTAGLMLYALQTASINLRSVKFESLDPTDVVIDRDTVDATSIGGPQWFEEDFEDDEEAGIEREEAEEDDSEHELTAGQENADPRQLKADESEPISAEEARRRVRAVVQNLLLKPAARTQ